MIHLLKTWPAVYGSVALGIKRFEYRKNDRNFRLGDTLELREYDQITDSYTGKRTQVKVTYILYGPDFGIPDGYCIMSIDPVVRVTDQLKQVRDGNQDKASAGDDR